ncbi:MAG: FG-GAP repeat protein, partial [Planctomycetota bacterium]|nr:FG-GAP repeat protein [Planctomycetota bacterium]
MLAGIFGVRAAQAQCEVQKLTVPDGGPGDFGRCVAMHGDLAVVGDPLAYTDIGTAYVYRYDPESAAWLLEADLPSPEPDPDD